MKHDKLAIYGGKPSLSLPPPHFVWPIITPKTEKAVLEQLHNAISIYNRSGIIKKFEDSFANLVGSKYALLCNSGTNALFGIFDALELGSNDEVIAPSYTFFATVSPLTYLGTRVTFVDCGTDGNILPSLIRSKITKKTKAIIITHMWGIPCMMDEIKQICQEHKLYLIEDCSHAHGATYKGKPVGTFGDAAAWSLQGQKILTGGEGGIIVTNNSEIYYRCLLQGHYNKRCKQEIPDSFPLSKFSLTGFGLKNRAHPLAIAIAYQQLTELPEYLAFKRKYAALLIDELKEFDFIRLPQYSNCEPSWYAFVFNFIDSLAGCTRKRFLEALIAEGLSEIDIPNSTCPIHKLPLFTVPHEANPRLFNNEESNKLNFTFPNAEFFYDTALKLPVWATKNDEYIVDRYIDGIKKVCYSIKETGGL